MVRKARLPDGSFDWKIPVAMEKISGLGTHAGDVTYNIQAGNMALIHGSEADGRKILLLAAIEKFRAKKK